MPTVSIPINPGGGEAEINFPDMCAYCGQTAAEGRLRRKPYQTRDFSYQVKHSRPQGRVVTVKYRPTVWVPYCNQHWDELKQASAGANEVEKKRRKIRLWAMLSGFGAWFVMCLVLSAVLPDGMTAKGLNFIIATAAAVVLWAFLLWWSVKRGEATTSMPEDVWQMDPSNRLERTPDLYALGVRILGFEAGTFDSPVAISTGLSRVTISDGFKSLKFFITNADAAEAFSKLNMGTVQEE